MKKLMHFLFLFCLILVGVKANSKSLISDPSLTEFTGNYKFKENPTVQSVIVKIDNDALVAVDTEGNVYHLAKVAGKTDHFTIPELEADVVFQRDGSKKVSGMTVKLTDGTLEAEKQSK